MSGVFFRLRFDAAVFPSTGSGTAEGQAQGPWEGQAQGPQRDVVDRRKGRFPTDRNAEAPSYTFSPLEGASIEGDTSGLFCQSATAIAQAILERRDGNRGTTECTRFLFGFVEDTPSRQKKNALFLFCSRFFRIFVPKHKNNQ